MYVTSWTNCCPTSAILYFKQQGFLKVFIEQVVLGNITNKLTKYFDI